MRLIHHINGLHFTLRTLWAALMLGPKSSEWSFNGLAMAAVLPNCGAFAPMLQRLAAVVDVRHLRVGICIRIRDTKWLMFCR